MAPPGAIKAKQTMERVRPTANLDGRQLRRDRQGVRLAALTKSLGSLLVVTA